MNAKTAEIYLNNIKIIKFLEDDFGFKSFFYWQPSIYTKQELSLDEETKIDYKEILSMDYRAVSDLINKSNDVTILTNIFDNEEKTVFIDWCHLSEEGNSVIAQKIAGDIFKYLEDLDR